MDGQTRLFDSQDGIARGRGQLAVPSGEICRDERKILRALSERQAQAAWRPLPGILPLACRECKWRQGCPAVDTEDACPDTWSLANPGGLNPIHPLKPDASLHVEDVGGLDLMGVVPDPVPDPKTPWFIPMVDRRRLAGPVVSDTYAVPAKAVVALDGRVVAADDFRASTGLPKGTKLVLTFGAKDKLLQSLWVHRDALIKALAVAGYDYVLTPSWSTWYGRPFLETRINLKRSAEFHRAMQRAGVQGAIPRVGWAYDGNLRDLAAWFNANPQLSCLALDLSATKQPRDFAQELDFASRFDRLTGRSLTYFIQGPSAPHRCRMLFDALGPDRVRLINSTAIARPGGDFGDKAETERLRAGRGRDEARRRRDPGPGPEQPPGKAGEVKTRSVREPLNGGVVPGLDRC